jgi:hypothetical protein
MSDSTAKNGNFGFVEFGFRTLAESDIAAARDIYGAFLDDACCASIAGKLTYPSARSTKLRVWAEDADTGRVIAQVEAAADGTFRIGGLHVGKYSVFWQRSGEHGSSSIGGLGTVELEMEETSVINERISFGLPELTLDYVGINGQLADLAVPVSAGRDYLIYVGGTKVDLNGVTVAFSSPFLKVSQDHTFQSDHGQSVSVAGFVVSVDQDIPPGGDSIFSTGPTGARSSLIGALNVENRTDRVQVP